MKYIEKFKPGDIVVKINIGSTYGKNHFTMDKEYIVLSAYECNGNISFNYIQNDIGTKVILLENHFNISNRYKRNETITEILD